MGERQPGAVPARPNPDSARFGEAPLAQTVAAAGAIRRLSSLLLSLEHAHPTVDAMVAQFSEWERELATAVPPDSTPRIGSDDSDESGSRRVYLDHATDIGAFNPCFPEYRFDHLDADTASGQVTFPLVYEGPPGLVHGGFLAVFFDCVTQHQNCLTGLSGKTRSLQVTFRRPDAGPDRTALRHRPVRGRARHHVDARLLLDDEVLCIGEVNTVAPAPDKLTGFRFGKRRVEKPDMAVQRIRQPRVAEIVASRLRDDILSGRLKEGDVLPSQESLFHEFGVSPPALREAIHILETDGLISVRRGNVGGAVVHQPSAERTAHMISMVLQSRSATPADVSGALMHLEPICAGMCAARDDRMTEVVPYLEAEIDLQTEQFDDVVAVCAQRPPVSRSAGLAMRQRADDPADRLARTDLVGARVLGLERRAATPSTTRWRARPGGPRCVIISDCSRPFGTAIRPGRSGSRRTTSPRLGRNTLGLRHRTKPLRRN